MSDKNSPIKFLPIDRINTIIAVAPNPGAFKEVEHWLEKLDIPIKVAAGGIKDYVYRVRYGDATSMACSIQALYGQLSGYGSGGGQSSIMACMRTSSSGGGGGFGSTYGGSGFGSNAFGGGGFGGGGFGGGGFGGYGPGSYGNGGYGGPGYGGGNGGGYGYNPSVGGATPFSNPTVGAAPNAAGAAGVPGAGDLTGNYLGTAPGGFNGRGPRVIANPMNNTLLIQATPQEYESIEQLIRELDVPPRQVLIEAKIYSVDLSHNFSSDVTAALQTLSGAGATTGTTAITSTAASLLASLAGGGVTLTGATLVGKSRALSGIVSLMESESDAKIISSPSIIATDSIPASINVGTTVPTEAGSTTSALGTVTTGVSNVSTGIGLNITARVTPSGIVTMIINQNVSDPQATDPTLDQHLISFLCDEVDHHAGDGSGRRHHRHWRPDPGEYHLDA